MADLFTRRVAELNTTKLLTSQEDFSGIDAQTLRITKGSRLIFYIDIQSLTGTFNFSVTHAAARTQNFAEAYDQDLVVGTHTIPVMDIQTFVSVTVVVGGGISTYSLGVRIVDNSTSNAAEESLATIATATVASADVVGSASGANTRPAITNVSTLILATNLNRKFAYVFNNTGVDVYLKLGAAAVIGEGIKLPNNAMYEITYINLWRGSVNAIKSGATPVNPDVFEAV